MSPRAHRTALIACLIISLTMGAGASKPQATPAPPATGVAFPLGVEKLGAGLLLCRPATNDQVEILLLRRRSKHHGGAWGLPGGNVEPGDSSLLATATREAHEELGGAVPPFAVRARLETRRGKRGQKLYVVFVAAVDKADAAAFRAKLNEEHSEWRWWPAGEVAALAATAGGGGGNGDDEQEELHPVVALAMREAGGAQGLGRLLLKNGGSGG